jgi:hypothetical protein
MDKVVIRFLGDDRIASRWTWYQDGKERWFEATEYVRSKVGAATAASAGAGGCH